MPNGELTEFELKCLRVIASGGRVPLGKNRLAFVSAMRRLEKKGLTVKGRSWCATAAGRKAIEDADMAERAEEWEKAPSIQEGNGDA